MHSETFKTSISRQIFPWKDLRKRPFDSKTMPPQTSLSLTRFRSSTDTSHSATIIGTTTFNIQEDKIVATKDASETQYFVDEHGVRTGFVIATARGYGHYSSEIESIQLNATASKACKEFIANTENLDLSDQNVKPKLAGALQTVAKTVYSDTIYVDGKEISLGDNESSLACTLVKRNSQGQLQCIATNVGNGMILVLNKNYKIKQCIAPRAYNDREGLSPMSISRLVQIPNMRKFSLVDIPLEDDDIVIHLSEGAWSQLPLKLNQVNERPYSVYYHESTIDQEKFSAALAPEKNLRPYATAIDIAENILRIIAAHVTQTCKAIKKSMLTQLRNPIKAFFNKQFQHKAYSYSYSVDTWLRDNNLNPDDKEINKFIQENYPNRTSKDLSAAEFISKLNGDSTAITVMRAPNRKLELIRRLINSSDFVSTKYCIEELARLRITSSEAHKLIQRLREETFVNPKTNAVQTIFTQDKLDEFVRDPANPLLALANICDADASFNGLDSRERKFRRQDAFVYTMNRDTMRVEDKNKLFEIFYKLPLLNEPKKNMKFDKFFGLHHSDSWQKMVGAIRTEALKTLKFECSNDKDNKKKIKAALKMHLFNLHRSNYFFTGAFGRTDAVKAIQALPVTTPPKPAMVELTPLLDRRKNRIR